MKDLIHLSFSFLLYSHSVHWNGQYITADACSIDATSIVRCFCFLKVSLWCCWFKSLQEDLLAMTFFFLMEQLLALPFPKLSLYAYALFVYVLLRNWLFPFPACFLIMFDVSAELLISHIDLLICFSPFFHKRMICLKFYLKMGIFMLLLLLCFLSAINSSVYL